MRTVQSLFCDISIITAQEPPSSENSNGLTGTRKALTKEGSLNHTGILSIDWDILQFLAASLNWAASLRLKL